MPMEQRSPASGLPNVIGHQAFAPPPPPPQISRDAPAIASDSQPRSLLDDVLGSLNADSDREPFGATNLSEPAIVSDSQPRSLLDDVLGSLNADSDSESFGATNLRQPGISEFPNATNLNGLSGTPEPSTVDGRNESSTPTRIFEAGTKVEYFSDTVGKWIPAVVIGFKNGHYKLDRKPKAPQSKVRAIASDSSSVTQDATDLLLLPSPPESQPKREQKKNPVDEMYEQEEARVSSSLQESALKRLREWDVDKTGHFTSNEIIHLVHEMAIARQVAEAVPQEKMAWEKMSCNKCIWIVVLMLIVWMPMLIASSLSRPIMSEDGGILTAKNGKIAATAAVSETHAIHSLPYLPYEKLRCMQECTFVHRYASHRLHVSSVIRTAEGNLIINSPHMSRLKVEISSEIGARTRMIFEQDFVGEEEVDMNGGCGFTVMTPTSKR